MTGLLVFAILLCAGLSALTGALAYALRDFSRPKLEQVLEKMKRSERYGPLVEHAGDFTLLAASMRILTILLLLGCLLQLANRIRIPESLRQISGLVLAALLAMVFSVGLASSLARYFGEHLIARLDPMLHALRAMLWPVLWVMHRIDTAVFHISPAARQDATEQAEKNVEEEILAVVEEGEKEGVVDETDREMIESVIEFRDTTAMQIMTARPSIVALPLTATLAEIVTQIEQAGHSRLPVYERDLDHLIGVLYARDLITILGDQNLRANFDLKKCIRPVLYIPETKPLKDLLREFKLKKVHLAIVLDEFGGTAGLITIEDVLEELVGEISDEHEPSTPAAMKKLDDTNWEIDASTYIDEVNTVVGLTLPEDEGFDTLGGYLSSKLGRIPEAGDEFDIRLGGGQVGKWKVLDAEPTRVNRVRLSLSVLPPETPDEEVEPAKAEAE